jgi:hypothetical protein
VTTPFTNSIVGEQGTLVRAQVKSPNFSQANQTGWAITKNGDAYFYNITLSGDVIITGGNGWFIYDGAPALGNPPAAYGVASGTTEDPFGNTLPFDYGIVSVNAGGSWSALSAGFLLLAPPVTFQVPGSAAAENAGVVQLQSGLAAADDTQTSAFLNSAANGGSLQVTGGADGNTYDTQRLAVIASAAMTVDSETQTAIPGLSIPVTEDLTYDIEVDLFFESSSTNRAYLNLGGPAVSFMSVTQTILGDGVAAAYCQTSQGTQPGSSGPLTASQGYVCRMRGRAVFSASGDLTVEAAASANATSYVISAGALLAVEPVTT